MLYLVYFLLFLRVIQLVIFSVFKINKKTKKGPIVTLVVVGSGGHTTEMFRLIKKIDKKIFSPRYYLLSYTDLIGANKINKFEDEEVEVIYVYQFIYSSF
jgi:beta-1,4-N-acetylglucosaminyltransferase